MSDSTTSTVARVTGPTVNGRPIEMRRLCPADADAIRALYGAMDLHDRYFRFFTIPHRDLEPIARAIARDDPTHTAVGAFDGEHLLGVANFVALDDHRTAEVAMVVAHDAQLHGIGTALLVELGDLARAAGVRRFVADFLAENVRMRHLIEDAGWPVELHRDREVVHVVMHLPDPNPAC